MVLLAQCPSCAKYMIFEDESRGARVTCLICRHSIQLSGNDAQQQDSIRRQCQRCSHVFTSPHPPGEWATCPFCDLRFND